MNDSDVEKLLEQGFSGGRPRGAFKEHVFRESRAALVRGRAVRVQWRAAALAAAAVLVVAVSFLCGRLSVSPSTMEPEPTVPQVVAQGDLVAVPGELVTWLEAARFFKQLGMAERVARAYEQASRLVPYGALSADAHEGSVFAADIGGYGRGASGRSDFVNIRDWPNTLGAEKPDDIEPSTKHLHQVIAQCFGG
jgi:hypothetical protein